MNNFIERTNCDLRRFFRMKLQGGGILTLFNGPDSLRVAEDLKCIAVAADMCPRLLRGVAKAGITLGPSVNRAADKCTEYLAIVYQDIYKSRQLTLLINLEDIATDRGRSYQL